VVACMPCTAAPNVFTNIIIKLKSAINQVVAQVINTNNYGYV
jgi:hypothetical protein